MSTQADPTPSAGPWIYRPWLDLTVGCGAWSAPLLLLAAWLGATHVHVWMVAFYLLAVVFNYPHFMATVYRAYHTREEFAKYRIFTLHLTVLLALTAILTHASFRLLPWVFTLYICWSPWHYSGQNYGLLMMFVRRSGAEVSALERRLLHLAFVASYVMLLVSFHTGPSSDPFILSLGLPWKVSVPARLIPGAVFAAAGAWVFIRLASRSGLRAMTAPLTLLFTQLLWFVAPSILEIGYDVQIPQSRYSSGILAVMHSAQYLWITSYYAQREARSSGNTVWRMSAYFGTLVAGGIALFIPGPWLVSYLFRYDFTSSFLIFTALVNIHHFILDGAIWKLRDSRIAALLVERGGRMASAAEEMRSALGGATRWLGGRSASAHAFRVAVATALLVWGGLDQFRFFLGTDENNLEHLLRAASLDPYDTGLQLRIARAATQAGDVPRAVDALARAVAANPANPAAQHARARALIESHRYTEAYEHYRRMLARFPRDPDALVNFGLLASQLGHADEAIESWQKALDVDPGQVNAQLYLAEALDRQNQPAAAARHYQEYILLLSALPESQRPPLGQTVNVVIEMGDAYSRTAQSNQALEAYHSAVTLAEQSHDARLESLALAHLGDLLDKIGRSAEAAHSYQRGLELDARSGDPANEAIDWFNYGQFLRRRGQPEKLAYACFLRAEGLLATAPSTEFETVAGSRRESEARLGRGASAIRKNPVPILAEATALQEAAFAARP